METPMRHLARSCPLVLLLVAAACGGGGADGSTPTSPISTPSTPPTSIPPTTPPTTPATSGDVVVANNSYSPGDVTVAVGSTVTWTWDACSDAGYGYSMCGTHSVTFDSGGLGSVSQSTGTYARTFTTAGTYTYHCAVHGTAMSGKVTVR
jgi:plastocyanin